LFGEQYIDQTLDIIKQNMGNIQSFLTTQIGSITSGGITLVGQLGGVIATWLIVMVSTFFMVIERHSIGRFILTIAPKNISEYLERNYTKFQDVFSAWIKAMFVLSLSIFITTYIGLYLLEWIGSIWVAELQIEKKFTLALIGGIMEFIPYFGPLLALIPAAIIGLGISWKAAIMIIALYLIIQRIENDVLVPRVMSRALNLSPFLVFVVMIAGASLG
jgi:predicted PurR-regulated permease PerM